MDERIYQKKEKLLACIDQQNQYCENDEHTHNT